MDAVRTNRILGAEVFQAINEKRNGKGFDEIRFPVTTSANAEAAILYHGTRVDPSIIMKRGLLVRAGLEGGDTRMRMVDDVLESEFGVTRDQVPKWIWESEYLYERTKPAHLHMSLNFGTAAGYSRVGCEIKYQVRHHMLVWMCERRLDEGSIETRRMLEKLIAEFCRRKNGNGSYVYQVKIPVVWLHEPDVALWRRCLKRYEEMKDGEDLQHTTVEIRCLRHIPPPHILAAWQVHFKDGFTIESIERR